jgi:accessory colonization factor AcfC
MKYHPAVALGLAALLAVSASSRAAIAETINVYGPGGPHRQ